jgi:hypothetical protein
MHCPRPGPEHSTPLAGLRPQNCSLPRTKCASPRGSVVRLIACVAPVTLFVKRAVMFNPANCPKPLVTEHVIADPLPTIVTAAQGTGSQLVGYRVAESVPGTSRFRLRPRIVSVMAASGAHSAVAGYESTAQPDKAVRTGVMVGGNVHVVNEAHVECAAPSAL